MARKTVRSVTVSLTREEVRRFTAVARLVAPNDAEAKALRAIIAFAADSLKIGLDGQPVSK